MVDLQAKPDAFVALYASACGDESMSAKVPILQTAQDGVLIESMVILEYLDDLIDSDKYSAAERARARLWATLVPTWLSWFTILRADAGSEEEASAVAKVREGLRAMDKFLSAGAEAAADGPYVLGGDFSLAEAATAPFVMRLMNVLPGLRPELDPAVWLADDGLERLERWTRAVCARPSCVETLPPTTELQASYTKLLERFKAMGAAAPTR